MPTIPNLVDQSNAYPQSPGAVEVNPSRFGRDAAALSQLGGQIGDIGSKLLQARKQAEDADAVADAETHDKLEFRKLQEDAEKNFDPNAGAGWSVRGEAPPKRMAESLRETMDAKIEARMKSLPSGDAQRMYRARISGDAEARYLESIKWENSERIKHFGIKLEDRDNIRKQALYNNPSMSALLDSNAQLKNEINSSGLITGTDAEIAYRKMGRETVKGYFNAMAKQDSLTASMKGLQEIKNLPPEASSLLDGDDVMLLESHLTAARDRAISKQARDIKVRLDDVTDMFNGPPGTWKEVDVSAATRDVKQLQYLASISGSPVDRDQADRMAAGVIMGSVMNKQRDMIATAPPDKLAAMRDLLDAEFRSAAKDMGRESGSWGASTKLHYQAMLDRAIDASVKERNKEGGGAEYAERYGNLGPPENGPPSALRIQQRLAFQKAVGVPIPVITTPQERDAYKQQLVSLASSERPERAADLLESIQSNAGKFAGQAIAEIDPPEEFKVAANMDSRFAKHSVIDNFKNEGKIEGEFKANVGSGVAAGYDSSADEYFNNLGVSNAIMSKGAFGANTKAISQYRKAIILEAKKQTPSPKTDGEWTAALDRATGTIIGENFAVVRNVMVPRSIGGAPIDIANVDAHMQLGFDPQWVVAQGAVVPKGLVDPSDGSGISGRRDIGGGVTVGNQIGGPSRGTAYRFEEAIASGRWVDDGDGRHAHLEAKLADGSYATVTKKNGVPFTMDYLKASQDPLPEAAYNKKGWAQKLFSEKPLPTVAPPSVAKKGNKQ